VRIQGSAASPDPEHSGLHSVGVSHDRFGIRDLGQPFYAGDVTFMRAPRVEPSAVPAGSVAVVGLPIDMFVSARPGARWGPRGIREASLYLVGYAGSQVDTGFVSLTSGDVFAWPARLPVVDVGDVPVFPQDPTAQTLAATDYVREVARRARLTVCLGGDHFVAYPAARGVIEAHLERSPNHRIGFLHIDSHTDFQDDDLVFGRFHHGSCVRRLSELPGVDRIAWYGLSGPLEPEQLKVMDERGFRAASAAFIRDVGARVALETVLEYVADGVDALYVSIDIDVVNAAHAPATHTPVFEGIEAIDLLECSRALGLLENLIGVDLCEVSPLIDGSQRTERLAASVLTNVMGSRIEDAVGNMMPALSRVFWLPTGPRPAS
jgi:agmatinase